mmetsp:Transcript_89174/g.141974  ORF Transcript_89174/g.141974 Transcript_89174/m.141974 type:complete len:203 (-) Transcript_89174:539-1147(-)
MGQRHLELVLLLDEFRLLLGQIEPLQLHHQEEQLILQTVFGDGEVDDGAFGLDLRWIVRIGQLRLHEELEAVVEDDLLVSKLHHALVAALDGVTRDHRHDHGINAFAHVFDQHRLSLVQRHLEGRQHLGMAHACDLQAVVRLAILDPHNTLKLWIDDQTPALRVAKDGAVLTTHTVRWQALSCPSRHLCIRRQHRQGIRFGA